MRFSLKSVTLLYLLLACSVSGWCAKDSTRDDEFPYKLFEGRILFGANFSQLVGDTYAGYHKVGLNTGAEVYVHFNRAFGTSLELLYSQKGVRGGNERESYTVGTYIDKYYLNLNYAEAVLMLHFDTYVLDYEAGISYGRLIKTGEWAEADVPVVIDPTLTAFNSYDLSYTAGLSIRLSKHWLCNFRYQYSARAVRPWERVPPRYSDGRKGQYIDAFNLRLVYAL